MIDTDKYKGHTEDIERWQMMARSLPAWTNDKDEQLVRDAPLLLAKIKHMQYSYYKAVEQLQNTRLWIAKYEGVLKEMSNQASVVKCSALNIDEWIEGVKL